MKVRVAVPSMSPGGLKAQRSGHFGRCDVFTVADIEDGKIINVETISNVDHSEGGCLVPVNLLARNNVDAIVVGGMGLRPLLGFKEVGIKVYLGEGFYVEEAIQGYLDNRLKIMTEEFVCGGH